MESDTTTRKKVNKFSQFTLWRDREEEEKKTKETRSSTSCSSSSMNTLENFIWTHIDYHSVAPYVLHDSLSKHKEYIKYVVYGNKQKKVTCRFPCFFTILVNTHLLYRIKTEHAKKNLVQLREHTGAGGIWQQKQQRKKNEKVFLLLFGERKLSSL